MLMKVLSGFGIKVLSGFGVCTYYERINTDIIFQVKTQKHL